MQKRISGVKRADRVQELVKHLSIYGSSTISELADQFDVSTMTVRRDLSVLEDKGIVRIFHGGVLYNGSSSHTKAASDMDYSLLSAGSQHTDEKNRIGKRAAALISSDDTIIIDTGSTTECLARSIPSTLPITVMCYNLNILIHVSKLKNADIVFAGGYYHPETMLFESAEGIELIKRNRANKAFVAAAGIHPQLGVTSLTHEGRTKRAIMTTAEKRILIADSSKFGRVFQAFFAELSDFDVIVTDQGIPDEYVREIEHRNIELVIA